MDPVSTLSLAAAIVQFVDFGCRVLGKSHEIYKSASGNLAEDVETQSVTEQLKVLTGKIDQAIDCEVSGWNESEKDLKRMARICGTTSSELLCMLEELARKSSRFRSWDSFKKAFRSMRKRADIEKLKDRLEKMKSQLSLLMLQAFRDELSASATSMRNLTASSNSLCVDIKKELVQNRRDLVRYLEKTVDGYVGGSTNPVDMNWQLNLARRQASQNPSLSTSTHVTETTGECSGHIDTLFDSLECLRKKAHEASAFMTILNSLRFSEMPARHIEIPPAYAQTNRWILEEGNSLFRAWLVEGSGVFWINGKAGSGKSTLMKFLVDSKLTQVLLEDWGGFSQDTPNEEKNRRLMVASHFFWKSGYPMQKSMMGLMQCLLYRIFYQCPDLIPLACPERFKDYIANMETKPWDLQDLKRAIDNLLNVGNWPSKFCIFIDGLDEYAGSASDQDSLVQDLDKFAQCPYIKVCVSSRPWNVFQEAYGNNTSNNIILQEYNRGDLDIYITGNLEKNKRFRKLAADDPRAPKFAVEIRRKAQGVFLWVFLVVRSLLDGLSEDDDIAMLQSRLRALPPTLEEYFELMLRSIDPVYKRHTARALLIACNAMQPLPTIAYCHLQEEMSSPGYALRAPIESLTTKQVRSSQKRARSWINKWCRDLLEVTDSGGSMTHRVEFLHRTVKDFLMNEDTQQWFLGNSGIDFSPQLSLCRTYLAQAKGLSDACSASEFIHIAGLLMFHAKEYEISLHRTPYATIEELNRVGNVVAAPFSTSHCHWSTACDWDDSKRPDMCESNFLAYAIEFDLQLYVEKSLQESSNQVRKAYGPPLIDYAMQPSMRHMVLSLPRGSLREIIALLHSVESMESESHNANASCSGILRNERVDTFGNCKDTSNDDDEYESDQAIPFGKPVSPGTQVSSATRDMVSGSFSVPGPPSFLLQVAHGKIRLASSLRSEQISRLRRAYEIARDRDGDNLEV